MKITYRNELEDLLDWNMFHSRNSAAMRNMKYRTMAIWTSLICLLFFWIDRFQFNHKFVFMAIAISVIFCGFFSYLFEKNMLKMAKKLYQEGENKGILCEHSLEIIDSELIEKTSLGEQKTKLSAIEKVVILEKYLFIYISSQMAHVVPENRIVEGDFSEFRECLKNIENIKIEPVA